MKTFFRQVQFLSHIAIILIALLLGFVVLKPYLFSTVGVMGVPPSGNPNNSATVTPAISAARVGAVGQTLPLDNIKWRENNKTLVLYISSSCHFCSESVPFYKRLIKENTTHNVSFVAVLPQEENEAKDYLRSEGLDITQVRKTSFASIGITGTPTLLLVDQEGVVSALWRGKLSPEKEAEVLAKLSS